MKLLGFVGKRRTRVLLACIRLHETYGRCTVRSVAAEAHCSTTTAKHHLDGLRFEGLVTWEDEQRGTLRPLVRRVA